MNIYMPQKDRDYIPLADHALWVNQQIIIISLIVHVFLG